MGKHRNVSGEELHVRLWPIDRRVGSDEVLTVPDHLDVHFAESAAWADETPRKGEK